MASIPLDGLPHEKEIALPTARVESVATPALLDAGAEQQEKFGAATVAAGTGLAQVAFQMEQRENADVLFRNEAADKAAYIDYEANARKTRQGIGAEGVATETAAWWKERISKNMENMNPEQQRLYGKRISDVQIQSIHSMSKFESEQTEIGQARDHDAVIDNTINYAAATPGVSMGVDAEGKAVLKESGFLPSQIGEIKKLNAYWAAEHNWTPAQLTKKNGADITQLHQQVIQSLVKDNPAAAAAYFEKYQTEIDGSKRAEIGEFAKKATAAKVGGDAAQLEWQTNGPKGDNDAASVDVMAANIRKLFKDDTFARDAALTQLHQIDAERDKAIKARDSGRLAAINTMRMQGLSMAAVMQTPAWAQLDGNEQRKQMLHEEQISAARESRAFVREGRELQREQRNQLSLKQGGFETLMKLQDPDTLIAYANGDRNNIINLRTQIGDENTMKLVNHYDQLTKSAEALAASRIDNDTFKALAVRAGLNPDKKGMSEEDKDRLVLLKQNVNTRLEALAKTNGRPLTPTQRTEEAKKAFDDTAKVPGFWSIGGYGSGTDRPVGALTSDEAKKAVVMVDGSPVKLSSIDPTWAQSANTKAMKVLGRPLTATELAKGWMTRTPGKKDW
jgi:hypothetical protein